ncbi:hypothetical protein LINPERHAP2_LOCUS12184 [Linum perenne]
MAPGSSKIKKIKGIIGDNPSQGHVVSLVKRNPIEDLTTPSSHNVKASNSHQGSVLPGMFNNKGPSRARMKTLLQAWKDTVDEMEAEKSKVTSSECSTPNPATPSLSTPQVTTTIVPQGNLSTTSQSVVEENLENHIRPDNLEEQMDQENLEEQMDEEDFEEQMDEDDLNSDDHTLIRKPVRGVTRGLGLNKHFKRTGKKMEVMINQNDGRAETTLQSSAVANELGQIASAYVWPVYKKKADKMAIINEVMLKLKVKFDIKNIGNISVREKLWEHFMKIVKGRRATFHLTFKEHGNAATAKKHKPNGVAVEMWNNLCDYWEKDKVK